MAIRVECDACGYEFRARDEHAGRRARCPDCGEELYIPEPGRRSRPQKRPARNGRGGGRRKPGKQQSNIPPWVFAVIGGGGTLIVVLLVVVLAGGGDDPAPQPIAQSPTPDPAPATQTVAETQPEVTATQVTPPAATSGTSRTGVQQTSAISPERIVQNTSSTAVSDPADATLPTPDTASVTASTPNSSTGSDQPFASLADLIEVVEPSVVRISVEGEDGGGTGSGYIVDTEGTVVTNRHVIEGARTAEAYFQGDDQPYPLTGIYFIDAKRDIAILKLDCPAEKSRPVPLARESPRKGEDLVAFGAPLGFDFTATKGILSAFRSASDLAAQGIGGHEGDWIQHTVPISPGNSGGPLVNMKGEVVGMNTMTITIGQNLNFAISAADITEALKKKSSQPSALRPGSVPVIKPLERPKTIDIAETEQANEYFVKIRNMELLMVRFGFDTTGRITATVRSDLEDSIDKADITIRRGGEAFMVVGMELEAGAGTAGTKAVTINAAVFYRDDRKKQVYKIWDEKGKVGTVAGAAFLQGVVPTRMRSGIKDYFRKFTGAVNRAKLKARREASNR